MKILIIDFFQNNDGNTMESLKFQSIISVENN